MKRRLFTAGATLAFLFAAGTANHLEAQSRERIDTPYDWIDKSLRLGVYGGHVFADRGEVDIGPGPFNVFGLRLRTRVSSPLSLEINAGYGRSDLFVIDPRLESGPAAVDTVNTGLLVLEGGFQIALTGNRTFHHLHPYVTLTGGILQGINQDESTALSAPEDVPFRYEVGTAGMISGGLGVEWIPSSRLGIGFELRDHLWRLKTPDGFFQSSVLNQIDDLGLPAPRESDWTHNLELSGGLYYYF